MIVTHLSLTDFRNYATLELEIVRGTNVFVGSNGQGKTNLVEALAYLSSLSSHRVSTHQALIRQGTDAAVIRAKLEHGDRQILAELQLNRSAPNRAQVNRSAIKTNEVTRYFSSVMFAPEDLALVRGEPSGRRRFIDELLCQLTPRLRGVMGDYDRVLKQRNTLLKAARARRVGATELTTLDVWDDRLIALGTEIIASRSELLALLQPLVNAAYAEIAGSEQQASLSQLWSINESRDEDSLAQSAEGISPTDTAISQIFREALTRRRGQELERGVSLVGPHRDDIVFTLNELPARTHASHGESWSFALALKLAAARALRHDSPTGDPVIILDDVFAELDKSRRGRLGDAISDYEQVLITAAVLEDIPSNLAGHIVHIEAGAVVDGASSL
jgi:DNA replication and repair protein RecF